MDTRQRILAFLEQNGPSTPTQVGKEIGMDSIMSSAHLSELSSNGKVKISSLKIGSTPLYYLPGKEEHLEAFSGSLNDKQRKAFEMLRRERVLRDSSVEPVIRVALRDIKDFAKPLEVSYNAGSEIFWKWHTAQKEEAESLISGFLSGKEGPETPQQKDSEVQQQTKEEATQRTEETTQKETIKTIQKEAPESKKAQEKEKTKKHETQETFEAGKTEEKKKKQKQKEAPGKFLEEVRQHFIKKGIEIISYEIIKKNSEIDFIIKVPSGIGSIEYYCKAKSKKKVSEGDLSTAFVQGQAKKLPVLFITNGEMAKRAKEMLGNEFRNILVNRI
ncbi:hypothetical protein J4212_01955 [Candidatus Woesearchaeota archaeon]|nr:hypothetical protein [Candidatus Woesearchaeota archaeon]